MIIFNEKIIQHIPKTAGTALKHTLIKYRMPVSYMGKHQPLKILQENRFSYAKDYERLVVVREPVNWYTSWYNYHIPLKRACLLTRLLMYKHNNDTFINGLVPMHEFIRNALNIGEYFKNINFEKLKYQAYYGAFKGHSSYFLNNIQKLRPADFDGVSLYQFYVQNQIDDTFRIFRMETELHDFISYLGLPELVQANKTQYKERLSNESIRDIKNKYKWFYEKYYPDEIN